MTRALKAGLYSGIVCPGVGQWWLGYKLLACVFVLLSLISLGAIGQFLLAQAHTVVDQVLAGQVNNNFFSIYQQVKALMAQGVSEELSGWSQLFVANWLIAIISAAYLGYRQDKLAEQASE
ncbi:hypothetical protein [Shewanella maritima]|uniref:hypothetical protein n=1 Tax=Shewanella maritima TaxID=2520507 RepID=UPI00373582AD